MGKFGKNKNKTNDTTNSPITSFLKKGTFETIFKRRKSRTNTDIIKNEITAIANLSIY